MPVQGYYDAEFAPWAQGMRRIGTMIAAQPVMQANAQARQQQTQTQAAHQSLLGAQTQHAETQTQELIKKGQLVDALQRAAQQAQQDFANGVTDSPAVREFTGAASALTGLNGDDIAANMKQGIGTILARQGKVSEAAAVEDPMQTDRTNQQGKRLMTVQPGGAVYDPNTKTSVYQNPSAASQREGEYKETTQTFPEVPEQPAVEPVPARSGFLGFGARAAVPGKPAVPGVPPKTVKTRRKLGDAASAPMANQSQDPNDTEAATDPGGPEEQGEPPVVHGSNAEAPIAVAPSPKKPMTPDIAMAYLKKHGNRAAAEAAAKQDGYSW